MGTKTAGRKELSMESKTLEKEASHVSSKELKVPVIYYLSRNGHLEHPHLMEVPISSPQGTLCLKDVLNRLSFLRGQGMANLYSWSTKRSYKNGFVWQDLSENDFIYPCNGHEYVLKGTQLIETSLSFRSYETTSTPSSKSSNETTKNSSTDDAEFPATIKGRSHSFNSLDYKLLNAKTCMEFSERAANASTQTEDRGRQRMEIREKMKDCEGNEGSLEGGYGIGSGDIRNQKMENERPSGRMKASEVLMQLIMCRMVSPREEM